MVLSVVTPLNIASFTEIFQDYHRKIPRPLIVSAEFAILIANKKADNNHSFFESVANKVNSFLIRHYIPYSIASKNHKLVFICNIVIFYI